MELALEPDILEFPSEMCKKCEAHGKLCCSNGCGSQCFFNRLILTKVQLIAKPIYSLFCPFKQDLLVSMAFDGHIFKKKCFCLNEIKKKQMDE